MAEASASPDPALQAQPEYVRRTLEALGDRDPLEAYTAMPGELARRLDGLPENVLRGRPYTDRWTWTPLEIVGHLMDAEWSLGWRTRAVYCDDKPQLIGIGQDEWVARLDHNDADPKQLLADFTAVREINLRFWRTIPPDQLARVGVHNERGEESLGHILRLYAAHDVYHLNQFDRYVAAMR
ncbi:MAG: DinB family protein [Planctomycetota bacterium]